MPEATVIPQNAPVWVVEDDHDAARLAMEMCEAYGVISRHFTAGDAYRQALAVEVAPAAVVLDWRLREMVSASLYLFTRSRYANLPIIYWTVVQSHELPDVITLGKFNRVVAKSEGLDAFMSALEWALPPSPKV